MDVVIARREALLQEIAKLYKGIYIDKVFAWFSFDKDTYVIKFPGNERLYTQKDFATGAPVWLLLEELRLLRLPLDESFED